MRVNGCDSREFLEYQSASLAYHPEFMRLTLSSGLRAASGVVGEATMFDDSVADESFSGTS